MTDFHFVEEAKMTVISHVRITTNMRIEQDLRKLVKNPLCILTGPTRNQNRILKQSGLERDR
jgi:hypothetical protein